MITKIDWVSFSLPIAGALDGVGQDTCNFVETNVREWLGETTADVFFASDLTLAGGRAPYSAHYMDITRSFHLFWGGKQTHVLVEITGQGCEALDRAGQLTALLERVQPRLTRVDIAVDMPVATMPVAFVGAGVSDRFKARSIMQSETGETVYVGSRNSDRYARVYRYAEPHPRANMLRCEFVLRKENAKQIALKIKDIGLPECATRLGVSFAWRHPAWQPDMLTETAMEGWQPERRHANSVRWLLVQVFPAIARMHQEGVISDVPEFLEKHLFPLL